LLSASGGLLCLLRAVFCSGRPACLPAPFAAGLPASAPRPRPGSGVANHSTKKNSKKPGKKNSKNGNRWPTRPGAPSESCAWAAAGKVHAPPRLPLRHTHTPGPPKSGKREHKEKRGVKVVQCTMFSDVANCGTNSQTGSNGDGAVLHWIHVTVSEVLAEGCRESGHTDGEK
jgi:hypothetical protein